MELAKNKENEHLIAINSDSTGNNIVTRQSITTQGIKICTMAGFRSNWLILSSLLQPPAFEKEKLFKKLVYVSMNCMYVDLI